MRNLELDEAALLEPDEAVSAREAAAGEAADELVLGADPEGPLGQSVDLVKVGLPSRRVGLVSDEVEDICDRPADLDRGR